MAEANTEVTGITSIPVTGIYKEKQALAQRAYEQALADLAATRSKVLSQYGFTGEFDPETGKLLSYEVDPVNTTGLLYQTRKGFSSDYRSAREEALARGLSPTRGLGAQGISDLRFQHTVNLADVGRGFLQSMEDIARAQATAKIDLNRAMIEAEQEAIAQALQERAFRQAEEQFKQQMAMQERQFQQQMAFAQQQLAAEMAMAQMQAAAMQAYDPFAGMGGGGAPVGGVTMAEYQAAKQLVSSVGTARKRDQMAAQDPAFAAALHLVRSVEQPDKYGVPAIPIIGL